MDLSKLKLDVYDILGIILPGLLAVAEGWITLRGWNDFRDSITHLAGTELTFLLVCAFGIGHLVQELGDVFVHLLKGKRYLRRGRDEFWQTEEARLVKQAIMQESGHDIPSVDGAYDYCLTKLTGHFDKRGIFVATSDLCRSLVALSLIAMIPVGRIALFDVPSIHGSFAFAATAVLTLAVITLLAWRRMNRFRQLSEATVFRAYLGLNRENVRAACGTVELR